MYAIRSYYDINKKYKGNASDFMAYVFGKTVFADQEKLEAFLNDPSLKVMDKDPAFQVAESIFRITSYNVCYTKLLRTFLHQLVDHRCT